jgi:predicted DsbA family dithiol-disulfide isomerase
MPSDTPVANARALPIDIVSDVVCPWCFVGRRRLGAALAMRPDQTVALRWRPFQLDGTIPAGGLDRREYMTRKFGSLERIAPVHQRLADLGKELGIRFAFDAITRSPNTLDAHRLIRLAFAYDAQDDVADRLFSAYFEAGRDIGDREVLADVAAEAGIERGEAWSFLASDAEAEAVAQEIGMAQQLGIQGVPFFIFGGSHAVSGAEAPEVLVNALDQAAAGLA